MSISQARPKSGKNEAINVWSGGEDESSAGGIFDVSAALTLASNNDINSFQTAL